MPMVSLFSGSYCHGEDIAGKVSAMLGCTLLDDKTLIRKTGERFHLEESKLLRAVTGKASVFNKFTHEKERSIACLKVTVAEFLCQDNLIFFGFSALLTPRDLHHVLKVCMIADARYRIGVAVQEMGISEKEALKKIHRDDEGAGFWVEYLFKQKDPWAPALYDMVIPIDKSSMEGAAALIYGTFQKEVLRPTEASLKQAADFLLASRVEMELAAAGHDVLVSCKDGQITISINKHVFKLSSLEQELRKIVNAVPGVKDIETKVGPGYYQTDIYRKWDFEVPSKVLLVDDEREFVQMLSERLQMRDVGSAVVYDGEAALSMVEEEEPDVMVLDLKMPGIDGVEVLRRVKREHKNVEVIVLTGHGSKEIEALCMELGAFAYLEKPVDIEQLTETMKKAYSKIRQRKPAGS
jgi:two-component system, OmpR family, response regulator CpxR